MTATKKTDVPSYKKMVSEAILALKERGGSSRQAILKYNVAKYDLDEKKANTHVKLALKKNVEAGILTQVKGTGASGSFKIAKKEPSSTVATKKPITKKKQPAQKVKTPKKKVTKKEKKKTPTPKKKKTPTKPKKKVVKKPAKKVAKKATNKKKN